MALSSCDSGSPLAMKVATSNYFPYPPPIARYEDVIASPKLFMSSLEKLHATMGTKFMIPIIGGKELDLHRLFVEVTSRGGLAKIVRERRWKEVTAVFNFPSTATNASFVLRKYYVSLLHHYEQIYFFKAQGWTPVSADPLQGSIAAPVPASFLALPESESAALRQARLNATEPPRVAAQPAASAGSPVMGVIDGKFESGYLVTVTIGSEKLKGVLYEAAYNPAQVLQPYAVYSNNRESYAATVSTTHRRRRRKKSEIRRRDPAHPKPNRSGYNFFFAEQHARLKPLHPGKDREISRMIGELWNKLTEAERAVYQEKALKDKERYKLEMEDYREQLRTGQVIRDAVPLQQRLPEQDLNMAEVEVRMEEEESGNSPQTPDNENSPSKSESGDYNVAKNLDADIC